MPWDLLTATQRANSYVMKHREKAPVCTICKVKLFDFWIPLDEFMFEHSNKSNDILVDMRQPIINWIFNNYPFHHSLDKSKIDHHLNYAKDISIPVCTLCHGRIHHLNHPTYKMYKPVDKRPLKEYEKRRLKTTELSNEETV